MKRIVAPLAIVTIACTLLFTSSFALVGCSNSTAPTSSATTGSSATSTEVTAKLVDVLASLNAAYVGSDEANQCVAYGFGQIDGAPLAVLLDYEDGSYHYWAGSYKRDGDTIVITDDLTGATATIAATQNAGGSLFLRKEGITGTASLVSCFGTAGVQENLALYDEALLDFEISYLR